MNTDRIHICNSFYDFKDNLEPGSRYIKPEGYYNQYQELTLKINENNLLITTHYAGTTYKINFKKNQVIINTNYYYRSYDDDVESQGHKTLTILNNQITHTHSHRIHTEFWPTRITNTIQGAMSEGEIDSLLGDVVKVLECLILPAKLKEHLAKQKQFEAFFTLSQGFDMATDKNQQFMLQGNLVAQLFNSYIAPMAGIKGLSKDDEMRHKKLATDLKKKDKSFKESAESEIISSRKAPASETLDPLIKKEIDKVQCEEIADQNNIDAPKLSEEESHLYDQTDKVESISKAPQINNTQKIIDTELIKEKAFVSSTNLTEINPIQSQQNIPTSKKENIRINEGRDGVTLQEFADQNKIATPKLSVQEPHLHAPKINNTQKTIIDTSLIKEKDTVSSPNPLKVNSIEPQQNIPASKKKNISMMVLSGFITTLGIAAIAIAFTVLNTLSFGGLSAVIAVIGVTATLGGIGLFAKSYRQNNLGMAKELKCGVN